MKKLHFLVIGLLFSLCASGQLANDNTLTVIIDGKEFKTQPRQVKIGNYAYLTGNGTSPDKMLRIWLGDFYGRPAVEAGIYLIVNADRPDTKENIKKAQDLGKYKGIAAVRYVEETRSPRMEYHVGDSQNNADESLEVKVGADGFMEVRFSTCTLEGTYWKEKAGATVFGGVGRLTDKLRDKVVTSATGFDQDIDPEGRGYRRQDNRDKIVLTNCIMKLKKN